MMPKKIIKRDGRKVKFNPEKITSAIFKAFMATGEGRREDAKKVSKKVVRKITKTKKTPRVEEIQDLVETTLMGLGYYRTAKAYILYREQHKKIREVRGLIQDISIVEDYLGQEDWRVKENSNMTYSLQGLNCYLSSKVVSHYWLEQIYPPEIRNAHLSGDFHIHDLGILGAYTYYGKEVVTAKVDGKTLLISLEQLYELVKVQEEILNEKDEAYVKYPKKVFVLDKGGWTKVSRMVRKKKSREMYFIKNRGGRSVIVTDNHPMITKNGEKEAKEVIIKGDKTFTADLSHYLSQEKLWKLKEIDLVKEIKKVGWEKEKIFFNGQPLEEVSLENEEEGYIHTISSSINRKIKLTQKFGYFVGFTLAEGFLSYDKKQPRCVSVKQKDKHLLLKANEGLIENGCPGGLTKLKDGFELRVKNPFLRFLFEEVFKIKPGARNKTLPINVLSYNQDFVKGLISGVLDGDGSIATSKTSLSLRVSSRTLLEQMAIVMQLLGFTPRDRNIEGQGSVREYKGREIHQNYPLYGLSFRKLNPVEIPSEKYAQAKVSTKAWHDETLDEWHQVINKERVNIPDEFICDITTESGTLLVNGMWNHNCVGWDLLDLLRRGFKGVSGKIESKPAKHFKSALGQVVNFLYTLQGEAAGAQAFSNVDSYLSPFIRYDHLNYKEVKQAMQEFIFNLNVPTRVGFQTPFVNFTLDLKVPDFMKKEPVIIEGKPQKETWGDFQEEVDMFVRAFGEIMTEGDGKGRPFTFPIPTLNITKDFDWDNENYEPLWEMSAKYGIPYFCLDENTEIITENGAKKIREIKKGEKVLDDKGRFNKVSFKKKVQANKTMRIKGGEDEIICSENHRFPTPEGVKKAEDLGLKDKLLRYQEELELESGLSLDNYSRQFFKIPPLSKLSNQPFIQLMPTKKRRKLPSFSYQKNRFQTTIRKIKLPQDLDEELMELLGIILGDGSLKKNTLRIVNADREILEFTARIIKKKFGLTLSQRKAGHSKICQELSVNSAILISWLEHVGIKKRKRIPEICFFRSKKEIGALLRGLFDTDGSITLNRRKDHLLSISFSNKPLMNDTLLLLARICIIGKINKQRNRERICITGERNIRLFKKLVNFRIERKKNLLQLPPKSTSKPSMGEKIISREDASKIDKHYRYQSKKYVRVKSKEKHPYLFISNYRKEIRPIKIDKIERDKKPRVLYDITVNSRNHLFVLKNGIISHNSNFINSDMKPEDVRSMCCRLRLNKRELRKRGGGLFGANPLTGSIGVVTINMPRLGYLSKNENEFFERLERLMLLAKNSLEIKRNVIENFTENGLYPYSAVYLESIKESFGSYWKNHFSTIGLVGMNECLLNFMQTDIASEEGRNFAIKVLDHMRDILSDFQAETGNIYNLEATPAEGTTYRLARLDKKKYPQIIVANEEDVRDHGAEPYYTNSSHLPVGYTNDMFEALELQDELQVRYSGGTVLHGFIGEKMPSTESVKRLVKKVTERFSLPYFTITPTFSVCPVHGYLSGEHKDCPIKI